MLVAVEVALSQVLEARRTIEARLHRTPVFSSSQLGERLGCLLYLKAELFQKTGSFKPRGALNRLLTAHPEELSPGLITVSAGNHAQGLAWAAREVGVACTVVMPAAASAAKAAATRGYGAEVILHGTISEAFEHMEHLRRQRGLLLVHPFDEPAIVAGQGTVGLEILEQVPEVDVVVCPLGGGGLISGIALALKSQRPEVRVYGVEPAGAAVMRRSWEEGRPVRLASVETFADGLASPVAGELTYPMTRRYVDDILVVTEEEILSGVRALMTFAKLYPEGGGAAATAALLAGKVPLQPGETVVSVVSGGNLEPERLAELISPASSPARPTVERVPSERRTGT
ncbi:MAG: pyridoxal-phosphate dependent enzyme [Actinomycetota bacterium]|nr:pyridoxal-phosphate dependent enzyme [Actinomycetota bacterium]